VAHYIVSMTREEFCPMRASFFSSLDERKVITQIVGEIQTIERKLDWFEK